MERKICPHCDQPSYSSMSYTEVWTCAYCNKEFLAVEGEERGRPIPAEGLGPTEGNGFDRRGWGA